MKKVLLFSILASGLGITQSNASTFTSAGTGFWSAPATWIVTGAADADGVPDNNDDVIIQNGHNVVQDMAVGTCMSITTNIGGTYSQNSKKLNVYGNFTNNGTLAGSGNLLFRASGTISSTSIIGNPGDWYFYATHIIAAGTSISKINVFTIYGGASVTNLGSVYLTSGTLNLTGNWINSTNSSLTVGDNFVMSGGSLIATASGNTVSYKGSAATSILTSTSYYNLDFSGTANHVKTLAGPTALTVANNFVIGAFCQLNCNNLSVTIGGNYTNTGNFTSLNQTTFIFNGTGTQTISRPSNELFVNLTKSNSGTLQLACNIQVFGTTTLNAGTINPSTFSYFQTGASWLGNGGNCSLAATGKVVFNGTANQSIGGTVGTTFGNVEINAPGFTVALTTNNTGGGTTTLTSGILNVGAFNWFQSGASWLANGGTINTAAAGSIIFNGSVAQSIGGTVGANFGNIQFSSSNTVSLARDLTALGTTTLNSGTLNTSTFTYNQKGTSWVGNGTAMTVAAAGKVVFNGTASQTIGGTTGTTFGNVDINNPGFTVALTCSNTGGGNTTLVAGIFDPSTFIWHQAGASWLANGGTINTAATGSINFDGSVAQSIGGTVGANFGNIQVASSNTVSLARNLVAVKTLTISSGTLDISAGLFSVTVAGDFTHSGGSFTQRTGTVFLNGTAAQVVSGTTTFYDLNSTNTVGGVGVTGAITVSDILTVAATSFGTSGAGTITIPATALTTAGKIAPLGAGASLTGAGWIIQSFINGPATANWQYLGSPINGNLLSDWDNDTRFYMSGVGGNDGNTSPMFYSVRKYSTVDTWVNITTVSTALTPCKGFSVWMSDNLTGMTAPLIFDSRGVPNFGNKSIALNSAHYTLAANPYACPISFASVVAASSGANANFLCWQESGSYVTNPNSGNIATAQGFMAYAASGGTLNFTEACKNTSANPNLIRSAEPENYLRIRTSNDVNGLGGETVIQFMDDAANGLDANYDLPFLASMYEDATNIYSTDLAGTDLLLNALNSTPDYLDIPLSVVAGTTGNQMISFLGLTHLSAYSYATLENVATGEKVDLKLHDTYYYFAQNVGDKKNFILHLTRTGNCPLCNQNITTSLDASTLVYTNNSMIHVKFDFETATDVVINIFDVQGQEVSDSKNVTVGTQIVDISEVIAHGIYFVRITRGNEVVTKKIYL